MPAIAPCLWFDGKAEETANLYISAFRQGKIIDLTYCTDSGPGPKGSVLSVTFEISGQRFIALNGGLQYVFSPAMSLFVSCEPWAEVDELWENSSADGEKQVCPPRPPPPAARLGRVPASGVGAVGNWPASA